MNSTATALILLTASLATEIGGTAKDAAIGMPGTPPDQDWEFIATIYGWLPGLDGETGVDGFNVGAGLSMSYNYKF
jgi:hypothetical protein